MNHLLLAKNENFLIDLKGTQQFRSTSLEIAENKPTITLLKWSKGSVIDVDYLRKGYFTDKTQISFIKKYRA